jgi:hypothetical protein
MRKRWENIEIDFLKHFDIFKFCLLWLKIQLYIVVIFLYKKSGSPKKEKEIKSLSDHSKACKYYKKEDFEDLLKESPKYTNQNSSKLD